MSRRGIIIVVTVCAAIIITGFVIIAVNGIPLF
jgi:hypothetical protein